MPRYEEFGVVCHDNFDVPHFGIIGRCDTVPQAGDDPDPWGDERVEYIDRWDLSGPQILLTPGCRHLCDGAWSAPCHDPDYVGPRSDSARRLHDPDQGSLSEAAVSVPDTHLLRISGGKPHRACRPFRGFSCRARPACSGSTAK